MKKQLLFLLLIFSISFSFAQEKKVLFIGNSYTYVNELPNLFADVANSLGDAVFVDSATGGGMRLMDHASSTATINKIQTQEWDYVIIQAQSQEPSWSLAQLEDQVFPYAETLNTIIKENHSCTETVFFMTWGRKNGDASNCEEWPAVCTFEGMQERLMAGYMTMAEQNNATCAPIGLTWQTCREDTAGSGIELYSGDGSHPSIYGSYLSACSFYATLFHKSLYGANYPAELTELEATLLQEFASETVLSKDYNYMFNDTEIGTDFNLNWRSWYENGNMPIASFSSEIADFEVTFTDQSINATGVLWAFGDGETSSETNPSHVYFEGELYTVTQTVSNECAESQIADIVNLTLSDNELLSKLIKIYPNPANETLNLNLIDSNKKFQYKILSCNGQILLSGLLKNKTQLDVSALNSGLYFLEINQNNNWINTKLIIE